MPFQQLKESVDQDTQPTGSTEILCKFSKGDIVKSKVSYPDTLSELRSGDLLRVVYIQKPINNIPTYLMNRVHDGFVIFMSEEEFEPINDEIAELLYGKDN